MTTNNNVSMTICEMLHNDEPTTTMINQWKILDVQHRTTQMTSNGNDAHNSYATYRPIIRLETDVTAPAIVHDVPTLVSRTNVVNSTYAHNANAQFVTHNTLFTNVDNIAGTLRLENVTAVQHYLLIDLYLKINNDKITTEKMTQKTGQGHHDDDGLQDDCIHHNRPYTTAITERRHLVPTILRTVIVILDKRRQRTPILRRISQT